MHDVITAEILFLAIFAGILLNHRNVKRLEAKIDRMQADLSLALAK